MTCILPTLTSVIQTLVQKVLPIPAKEEPVSREWKRVLSTHALWDARGFQRAPSEQLLIGLFRIKLIVFGLYIREFKSVIAQQQLFLPED